MPHPLAGLLIRDLREGDFKAMQTLAQRAWTHTYEGIYSWDYIDRHVEESYDPFISRTYLPFIESKKICFKVAELRGEIVGYVQLSPGRNPVEMWLHRLYIEPVLIGKGLGSRLLCEAERFASDKGTRRLRLFVHRRNELGINFYLRKEYEHLVEEDDEDLICMEKRF